MGTDNPITAARLVFVRAGKHCHGTASPGRTPDLQSSDNPQPLARTKKFRFQPSIVKVQGEINLREKQKNLPPKHSGQVESA